ADRLVRQWDKIEMGRLAVMPQYPIRAFVGTVRHVLGRQVRQLGQDLVDLRPQPGGLGSGLGFGFPVLEALAQQWRRVFAALLGSSDFARDAITSGLRLLRPRLGSTPVAVEREDFPGARRQSAASEPAGQFLRVV